MFFSRRGDKISTQLIIIPRDMESNVQNLYKDYEYKMYFIIDRNLKWQQSKYTYKYRRGRSSQREFIRDTIRESTVENLGIVPRVYLW